MQTMTKRTPPPSDPNASREDKLAAALRANLRRRKAAKTPNRPAGGPEGGCDDETRD